MKSKIISLRLSDSDYSELILNSEISGMCASEFLRKSISQTKILPATDKKDDVKKLRIFSNASNNLNQIAHVMNIANKSGAINSVDYNQILGFLGDIQNSFEVDL